MATDSGDIQSNVELDLARRFEQWMEKHGRVYKDEAERARRFEVFKGNVKFIEEFNKAGEHSYTVGLTGFSDLTKEEFNAMYSRPYGKP